MKLVKKKKNEQERNAISNEKFLQRYAGYAVPLVSEYTQMSLRDQRARFIAALHGGNQDKICLARKIQYPEENKYYIDKNGKRREKAMFHHDFIEPGMYPFCDHLVFSNTHNSYVSANTFTGAPDEETGRPHRRKEDCTCINAILMDVDVLHQKEGEPYNRELADQLIAIAIGVLKSVFPEPTLITLSGRGFTWIYRYDQPIPITDKKAVDMHDTMFERLFVHAQEILNAVGIEVDAHVKDHSRVVRLAGTYNTSGGRFAQLYQCNPESRYMPIQLYTMLGLDLTMEEEQPKKASAGKKNTVSRKQKSSGKKERKEDTALYQHAYPDWLYPEAPMAYLKSAAYRIERLEMLASIRRMVDGSGRHRLLFAYACHIRLNAKWDEMCRRTWKLNQSFEEPINEAEFSFMMHAIGCHREKPEWHVHSDGVYLFRTVILAEFINLTEEENAQIHLCDSAMQKSAYEEHQAEALERDKEVAKFWLDGASVKIIHETLDGKYTHISIGTIKNILRRLGLNKDRDTKWEEIPFEQLQRYTRLEKRNLATEKAGVEDPAAVAALKEAPVGASQSGPVGPDIEFDHPADGQTLVGKSSGETAVCGGESVEVEIEICSPQVMKPVPVSEDRLPETENPHIIEETRSVTLTVSQQRALAGLLSGKDYLVLGTAGTGKTVILNEFRRIAGEDKVLAVAPSGKAALGIHGQTIHTAFQLPRGPIGPYYLIMDKQINALENIRYIIIDEIGMVRFDVMCVVIRIVQEASKRFGRKIPILCMGDFGQLPPVMTMEDRADLCRFWDLNPDLELVPYAFAAPGWNELGFWNPDQMSFLSKSQRSKDDAEYSEALMRIYQGEYDPGLLDYLNSSYDPNAMFRTDAPHICGRKSEVARINETCISAHRKDPSFTILKAEGSYASGSFPVDQEIPVFIGMPVLTCVNGTNYQNGEYGTIIRINKQSVRIQLEDETQITVRRRKILSDDGLSFIRQIPILPAYAMTFHRVQGATLSRAIIHPDCWAPGQLYVGLSRIRTKEGLILASPITPHAIVCDPIALQAYNYVRTWAA